MTGTNASFSSISYTPTTPSNWEIPPTTIQTALDNVAFASNIASSSKTGVLNYTDWTTFNNKQPAGNYITSLTGDVGATGPGTVTSVVNSIGGVTAYQVASFTNNANIIRVNKDGSGNFTSINTALASITGASKTNTYKIQVGPGVFTENTINCKPYVWIEGQNDECTIIQTNNPNQHAIVGCVEAGISKVTINGATGVGYAGVFYQGNSNIGGFTVYDCRYGNNYTLSICDSTNGPTLLHNIMTKIGDQYSFTYGWMCTRS